MTGFEGRIEWDTTKPNGQPRRSVDATRARELFGFEARTPLREGLERTVAWYREQRRVRVRLARAASTRASSSARRCARIEFWSDSFEITVE